MEVSINGRVTEKGLAIKLWSVEMSFMSGES